MTALHHRAQRVLHVVPEVIETELVVGPVGYVRGVSLLPLYSDKRLIFKKKNSYRKIVPWLLNQIERTLSEPDSGSCGDALVTLVIIVIICAHSESSSRLPF